VASSDDGPPLAVDPRRGAPQKLQNCGNSVSYGIDFEQRSQRISIAIWTPSVRRAA
jgi:hypothetical protein